MLAEVEELSVLLWLVESEQVRRSPGERLSENLLAVITPTPSTPPFSNVLTRSILTVTPWGKYPYYLHFTEKTAESSQVTCPRSQQVIGLGFLLISIVPDFSLLTSVIREGDGAGVARNRAWGAEGNRERRKIFRLRMPSKSHGDSGSRYIHLHFRNKQQTTVRPLAVRPNLIPGLVILRFF